MGTGKFRLDIHCASMASPIFFGAGRLSHRLKFHGHVRILELAEAHRAKGVLLFLLVERNLTAIQTPNLFRRQRLYRGYVVVYSPGLLRTNRKRLGETRILASGRRASALQDRTGHSIQTSTSGPAFSTMAYGGPI